MLLYVHTYYVIWVSIQVLCMCIHYEYISNHFFVVYEVLVDKKDKYSSLPHSSTLGLK